jgi:SAM-dependent methyltransferase
MTNSLKSILSAARGRCVFPAEFDRELYRRNWPDLGHMDDANLDRHYVQDGINEGRQGSQITNRADFFNLVDTSMSILEIGPFVNPAVRGPRVKYFDVLPTEGMRQKAVAHGLDPTLCPSIDFVSETGDLSIIPQQFDVALSSHSVEHQPDLIRHFLDVAKLLAPGGHYFLAVPDKRYCFDHFIAESTIADVLDAHIRKIRFHDAASVIEHLALTTHNDATRHWKRDHGEQKYKSSVDIIRNAANMYLQNLGTYIDVHAWQFVSESFRDIMQVLFELGFSPLKVSRVYPTVRNSNEFYAILEKTENQFSPVDEELPEQFNEDLYLAANPDVAAAHADAKMHYVMFGRKEKRKLRP